MKTADHKRDEDCHLGPDGFCLGCGVTHGDPCPDCQQRAFHREDCPRFLAGLWLERRDARMLEPFMLDGPRAAAAALALLREPEGYGKALAFAAALKRRAADGAAAAKLRRPGGPS